MVSIVMIMEYKYDINNPSSTIEGVGLLVDLEFATRNWKSASIPAIVMLMARANERAVGVLLLIITQALRMEMNPPLASIPESTSAMLHIIIVLATTKEYVIPPTMDNNRIKVGEGKILRFSKQLKAMKRTQKEVAFAEMIRKEFHSCVWRMELKIPAKDGGFLWWWVLRD